MCIFKHTVITAAISNISQNADCLRDDLLVLRPTQN